MCLDSLFQHQYHISSSHHLPCQHSITYQYVDQVGAIKQWKLKIMIATMSYNCVGQFYHIFDCGNTYYIKCIMVVFTLSYLSAQVRAICVNRICGHEVRIYNLQCQCGCGYAYQHLCLGLLYMGMLSSWKEKTQNTTNEAL